MAYSPEQIAAFVGAAAWLPQLATWAYRLYRKPKVVIIPDTRAELGYTNFGPIFNIRLAVSGDVHDVLLDSFSAEVRHESGDVKTFRWQGTKETLSQVRDSSGIRQTVEKDETGIAIKVRPDALVDKFFRFQDPSFASATRPLLDEVLAHYEYLLAKGSDAHEALMGSDKLHTLLSAYRSNFSWRPGKYVAVFQCKAIHSAIAQSPAQFKFELTPQDVERLRQNFDLLEPYFEWHTFYGKQGKVTAEPTFNWAYPSISR